MSDEYVKEQWEKMKQKIREDAANRGELTESNLDELPDRKPKQVVRPDKFKYKDAESPTELARRIKKEAQAGDADARYEWNRMRGITPDGLGWSGLSVDGDDNVTPAPGHRYDPREERAEERRKENE